jgi:NAD(P)H dehydrogenase (quinone)
MKRILITGANGKIGGFLIPSIVTNSNVCVRTFSRNEALVSRFQKTNVECVTGCFENAAEVRAAVNDVDTIVLITPANPHATTQAEMVVSAAKQAGVRKIIRVSVFKAAVDGPTSVTKLHGETDKLIRLSGMAYTILRPGFFMQNLLFLACQSIVAEGKIYFGTGEGKFGMIDLRDIADCIEQIIVSNGYDNEVLTLTGPESISFQDIADQLSRISERPIDYVPITAAEVEQWIQAKDLGSWYATVMRQLCEQYAKNWGRITTNSVERITGRSARSFDTFAHEILVPAINAVRTELNKCVDAGTITC